MESSQSIKNGRRRPKSREVGVKSLLEETCVTSRAEKARNRFSP